MTNIKQLQRLIDKATKTGQAAHKAIAELDEFCIKTYGTLPSDVDEDYILDSVYGACGLPSGLTAAEFDEIMNGHKTS